MLGYDEARKRVMVALRGTLSFMDVIDDIENAVAVDYGECDGCKVGAGWLDATTKLMEGITEALKGLVGKWGEVRTSWGGRGGRGARGGRGGAQQWHRGRAFFIH